MAETSRSTTLDSANGEDFDDILSFDWKGGDMRNWSRGVAISGEELTLHSERKSCLSHSSNIDEDS